ncbi:histone deacetylase family protein [Oceaniglobus trochenteri]|uniref:histone deacetylase family protein n=1 Tax=Oceaniglobus trochenteri TaxID=2763260 RepID=UPI001CFFB5BF|nr:histone deacetylase family protein [Oceaniglobus trochenteri]
MTKDEGAMIYFSHDDGLAHVNPPGHPEQVARLEAVGAALAGMDLDRRAAPLCDDAEILRCHPRAHLDRIAAAVPAEGWRALDADTSLSPGSLTAARRAVGGCVAAVDAVLAGEAKTAFVGCRPPGHHAERETPMGFCLFGNIAIAAMRALDHHGLDRVAVVDFDVHHGNGTQDLLWDEGRALFVSSHQMPLYPGTGAASERGAQDNVLNLPLAAGSGGEAMRALYEDRVFPALRDFAPDLLLISAGFDAHAADPLAGLNWSTADFGWLTGRLCDLADELCGGRIVSTLEGGYDLQALGASVAAHVAVLKERSA